jgi:Family of unknown function (DUF6210)
MTPSSREDDERLWATQPALLRLRALEERLDALLAAGADERAFRALVRGRVAEIGERLLAEERDSAAAERQLDEQLGRVPTLEPGPASLSRLEAQAAKHRAAATHATSETDEEEGAFLASLSRDDQRLYHMLTTYAPRPRRAEAPARERDRKRDRKRDRENDPVRDRENDPVRVVPLYGYPEDWAGCLFPCPSGVVFHQQIRGLLCDQAELEGALIPLPQPGVGAALYALDAGCCGALLPLEAALIDLELCAHRAPLTVDLTRLSDSTEAWVWVRVEPRAADYCFFAFRGQSGVLTYENCD